jgi:predicted metal-dependent hydrolase
MLGRLNTIFSNNRSDPIVDIEGEDVPVRIKRTSQARRISMRADVVKREIRITMPVYTPTSAAMDFVAAKMQWLAARLHGAPQSAPMSAGGTVAFAGEPHRIVWVEGATRTVKRIEGADGFELQVGGPEDRVKDRILRWLQSEARQIFAADIADYCDRAGAARPRLSLGDPRSRWGSCSSRGTISLSWRLIMAPASVRRSVIAHEVAHIRHMDHSPAFYAWFETLFEGDRKAADRWLKMHGTALQRVGR